MCKPQNAIVQHCSLTQLVAGARGAASPAINALAPTVGSGSVTPSGSTSGSASAEGYAAANAAPLKSPLVSPPQLYRLHASACKLLSAVYTQACVQPPANDEHGLACQGNTCGARSSASVKRPLTEVLRLLLCSWLGESRPLAAAELQGGPSLPGQGAAGNAATRTAYLARSKGGVQVGQSLPIPHWGAHALGAQQDPAAQSTCPRGARSLEAQQLRQGRGRHSPHPADLGQAQLAGLRQHTRKQQARGQQARG